MTFQEWLKHRGLTIEEGARVLRISKSTFVSYVYREKEPRLTRAVRLSRSTNRLVSLPEMTRKVRDAD